MNTSTIHKTVSFSLEALKQFRLSLRTPEGYLCIEPSVEAAIHALSAWEKVLASGRGDYLREREAAFKAMGVLKASLAGRVDFCRWNELCLIVDVIGKLRKADDLRY